MDRIDGTVGAMIATLPAGDIAAFAIIVGTGMGLILLGARPLLASLRGR